jgi:hypothetical protein
MFDQLMTRASLDLTASMKDSSKTAELLGMLERRPMNTFSLASEAGITSRQVWGLLKYHKDRGRVRYCPESGIWECETAQEVEAIQRAARLLRSKGWKCTPPGH